MYVGILAKKWLDFFQDYFFFLISQATSTKKKKLKQLTNAATDFFWKRYSLSIYLGTLYILVYLGISLVFLCGYIGNQITAASKISILLALDSLILCRLTKMVNICNKHLL